MRPSFRRIGRPAQARITPLSTRASRRVTFQRKGRQPKGRRKHKHQPGRQAAIGSTGKLRNISGITTQALPSTVSLQNHPPGQADKLTDQPAGSRKLPGSRPDDDRMDMLQVRTQKSGKGRIHPGKQAKSQPNRPAKQNLPKRKISDQIQLTIRQHHNTQSDKNNNRKLHGKRRSREAIRAEPRPGRKTIPHTKPQQGAETAPPQIQRPQSNTQASYQDRQSKTLIASRMIGRHDCNFRTANAVRMTIGFAADHNDKHGNRRHASGLIRTIATMRICTSGCTGPA